MTAPPFFFQHNQSEGLAQKTLELSSPLWGGVGGGGVGVTLV
ncbi:hypothetical protein SAMN02927923_04202 [Microvirga guangxiensis]|uniref:Uncharacterized protein n=1 Tax=Microvirga guangxiensis TaxID=549386 RepID=A0A1G5LE90_9HYPH|nr:hypothetical protein SAMN02927923_04202 [Microvirga guangxiensis]